MIYPPHPPSNVVQCSNAQIQYLCEVMRPDERVQWEALNGRPYSADAAALGLMNLGGVKFTVLGADGIPVCAGGFDEVDKGVWRGWMVGSLDGWKTHWRSMTKTARWIVDGLFEIGARRVYVNTISARDCAIDWYVRFLGLKHEGTWRRMAANGADVACYAVIAEDRA